MPIPGRVRAVATTGLLAVTCLCVPLAQARPLPHSSSELTPFERAEQLREALEGRPEAQRTRAAYNRVLEAFRAVYHGDPASPKADASINAVADLLAEEGRVFEDEKLLYNAIGQYEFLRQQYPGSRYRFSALLTEGEIDRRDLNDRIDAKAKFAEFVQDYPHHPLAAQARTELNEIRAEEMAENRQARRAFGSSRERSSAAGQVARSGSPPPSVSGTQPPFGSSDSRGASGVAAMPPPASPSPGAASRTARARTLTPPPIDPAAQPAIPTRRASTAPPITPAAIGSAPSVAGSSPGATGPAPATTTRDVSGPAKNATAVVADLNAAPPPRRGRAPLVTQIRHWSTPVYTRIAIDLQDQVQYEAARVPNPDRVYFDLHGARLAPELIGKSVEVTDDGFLRRIRAAQFSNDVTRIVLDVNSVSDYSAFFLPNPWRLIIDVHGRSNPGETQPAGTAPTLNTAENMGLSPDPAEAAGTTAATGTTAREVAALGQEPDRIRATRHPTTAPIAASVAGTTPAPQPADALNSGAPATPAVPHARKARAVRTTPALSPADDTPSPAAHEAEPTAAGQRSLVRALGLKIGRIVIDPGHGGHDSGTLGPGGLEEKEIVLDVSLRLGRLLKQRLGADVIYTRATDTFIPLETRTAIANRAQADLFLSVHANSSPDPEARGVETYYLNFTTSPEALEVAARENAVSDQSIHELAGLVKKIALKDKIDESHEFAGDVQRSLYDGLEDGNPGLRDRGVKKAPFVVLIGANMPSILAEISFLTNPDDASELRSPAYRQRIALSLYRGVAKYISGLSGVRLAENTLKPTGN